METRHTPGPWKYEKHATLSGGTIVAPSQSADGLSEIIAHALSSPNDADMALIAAAPDLLEACTSALGMAEMWNEEGSAYLCQKLERAISKARPERFP